MTKLSAFKIIQSKGRPANTVSLFLRIDMLQAKPETKPTAHDASHKKALWLKRAALAFLVLIIACVIGFFAYTSDYYRADETALEVLETNTTLVTEGSYTLMTPEGDYDTAFIFYPGGKVEAIAYLPILEKLTEQGIACILMEMPFNLAFFDIDAADGALELLPDCVEYVYVGGHSLGGAMSSAYAADNSEKIDGLILLGSYIYGDYSPSDTLTIYGTFNSNLEANIDYTENIVLIEGGNHAQFGNYGKQDGDPDATITAEEQQNIAVEAIVGFVEGRK